MNKKNYNVEGYNKPFTVTEDKEKEFLAWAKENNKQYELASEDLGKQSSSAADATVEQTTTASTQDTVSKSDSGFLESQDKSIENLSKQKTPEEAKEIVNSSSKVKEFYNWINEKIDESSWLAPGMAKIKGAKIAGDAVKGVTKGLYNLATGEISKIEKEEDRKLETYKKLSEGIGADGNVIEFMSGIIHSAKVGEKRSEGVDPTQNILDSMRQNRAPGKDDIKEVFQNVLEVEAMGTTDATRGYQKTYDTNKNKHGGAMAWGMAVAENPEFLLQTTASSLAMMIGTVWNSNKAKERIVKAGGGAAIATGIATAGPDPTDLITMPGAFMAGSISAVSGTMEQSFTFVELLQEQLKNDGKDFNPENIKAFFENDEVITYKDPRFEVLDITATRAEIFKIRASRRGLAIGFVDGMTGAMIPGVVGGMAKGLPKKLPKGKTGRTHRYTKAEIGVTGSGIAVGGGLVSEVAGQTAGGQEYDVGEILTEGVAEKAVAMTGITTIPTLLKKRGVYEHNGERITEKEFLKRTNDMSDLEILEATSNGNLKVENDKFTENRMNQRSTEGYIDSQIDPTIKDPAERRKLVELEIERRNLKTKLSAKDLPFVTKNKLTRKLEEVENEMTHIAGGFTEQTALDTKGPEVEQRKKEKAMGQSFWEDLKLKDTKDFLEKNFGFTLKGKGRFVYAQTPEEAQAAYDQYRKEYNANPDNKDKLPAVNVTESDGFFVGENYIINKQVAATKGKINVGGHELLHGIVDGFFESLDIEQQRSTISKFRKAMGKKNEDFILKLLENRNKAGESLSIDSTTEWFNMFSDAITENKISYNEGIFNKLKNSVEEILRLLSEAGYIGEGNALYRKEFANGRQAYNFLKDYNKSIKKKEEISERVKKMADISAEKTVKPKLAESKTPLQTINDLVPSDVKTQEDYYKLLDNPKVTERIFDGRKLAPVIENYIRSKSTSPEEAAKNLENVRDRLVNFDPAAKRKDGSTIGPKGFGEFIFANVRFGKFDAKKDLFEEGQMRGKTDRIDQQQEGKRKRDIADTSETVVDEETGDRYSKLRKVIGLTPELITKVKESVVTTFGTRLPNVKEKDFRKALQKSFKDALFTDVKKILGKAKSYDDFLKNNFEAVYNLIPTQTLTQIERSVKDSNRIFVKEVETNIKPTVVDDYIADGILPKDTNRTSGPSLFEKQPYPGEEKVLAFFRGVDMENQLGYKVAGSTLGTRKDGLSLAIATELGFDATMEVVQQPEVMEKRATLYNLKNQSEVENDLATIAKQIDRDPRIKFSKSGEKFYRDGRDLANEIAVKGGIDGVIEITQVGKTLKYKGVGKFKTIPEETLKHVVEELYSKNKIFLHQGELFNRIAKGIKKGDTRTKGFEQFVMNQFAKIDGVKLIIEIQSEEGVDVPDVYGKFYDQDFNIEVKLFDAQVSSLTINDINVNKGKFTVNKMKNLSAKNQKKMQKLLDQMLPPLNDIQKRLKQLISDPRANAKDKVYLKNWNSPKDLMPNWAHSTLKKEGYFKRLTQSAIFDQTIIEDLYLNKAIPTNYIYMLGKGFFNIKSDAIGLNSPKLEGTFKVPIRQVKASQYKQIDGIKTKTGYVNLNIRALPVVDKITSKSNMDILDDRDVKNFINKDVRNILKAKQELNKANSTKKSLNNRIKYSKSGKAKGMSTFDFDETVGVSENFIIAKKGKEKKRIASNEWPFVGQQLENDGWTFDFSDFNKVTKGKPGPLFQKMKNQIKKYGPENVFILTARAPQSEQAIHDWLKSNGINIPRKNVTGLGDSTGQAKADWMLEKFAEGYNDMYFVDDAITNVEAVKNVLEQLDIKSKVVQAKIKFSKDASKDFNDMLERTKGINADKIISQAAARSAGQTKGRFEFFVPPSAEDFKGLIYRFLGKGKQGETDLAWFKENLFTPFAKAIRAHDTYRQNMANEWRQLKKDNPKVVEILNKKVKGTDFTNDTAVRVYLWDKAGFQIPGLSEQEQKVLVDKVNKNKDLKNFAEALGVISRRPEGYLEPDANWVVQTTATDLNTITSRIGRREFLQEWIENKDVIFSEQNLNKIQAIYGTSVRTALEGILYRMEFGTNRTVGKDANVNLFLDWINGSVGATMFFNMRSAILQTISTVNFINMSDNNLFKAAAAFANQPQFWKDFSFLFNSDMLRQRRAGLQTDVNAAELTKTFTEGGTTSIDKIRSVIRYMLQKGFLPTQIADSFAIASGGASFYRNRIKKYVKEGMSENKAKEQAFLDFQEIAEETQQSSRPDLISEQQAGVLGRLILAWQNTPMQMTRLTKKAISDLVNNRGDAKANISKILYYGFIQNIIFGTLQSGLAFLLFGNDEEEDKVKLKTERVLNGALDTVLRGTGIYGAAASTLKNTIMTWQKERQKDAWKRENLNIAQTIVDLSPPMGSKMRKIMNAVRTEQYNKGVGEKIGFRIENPYLSMAANVVEAGTNIPLARLVSKANNLEEAVTGNHQLWQRVAMGAGWSRWSVNVKDEELEKAKAEVKQDKKDKTKAKRDKEKQEEKAEKAKVKKQQEEKEKKEGVKEVRCSGRKSNGKRCSIMVKTNAKTAKCMYHKTYKPNEASDRDGDGIKEYRCVARKANGQRCKNRTENKNKKCYAHNK